MFSVIDNVLLRPFPYAHQQRLYSLVIRDLSGNQAGERTLMPPDELLNYREHNHVFDDVMGVAINRAVWNRGEAPQSVNAPMVTANAFQLLGVPPLLGRTPLATAFNSSSPPVCVMSYAFWKSQFNADSEVIGRTLILDEMPRTVVAVMPPRFVLWSGDVWLPVLLKHTGSVLPPWYYMLGRLKTGLDVNTANNQLQHLAEQLAPSYRPNLYTNHFQVSLQSFIGASTGKIDRTLYTLLAAVGLLLLIACSNVANLLLARAAFRKRELAVRASLGAGYWRILRQLFLESALLAAVGAALGCAMAWGGLKVLLAVLPPDTFPDEAVVTLNYRVLLATSLITVLTALFLGVVPTLGGLRQDVNEVLKSGGRAHSRARRAGARNLLIVCEVAISLVLLSAAALTLRSFLREREVPTGLATDHVLTAQIFLTKSHRTLDEQQRFVRDLASTLQQLPGVTATGVTTDFLPFGGAETQLTSSASVHVGQAEAQFALVNPGFFQALKIPLLAGRALNGSDIAGKHMVGLVNLTLARKLFPNQNPIGGRLRVDTLSFLPQPFANPWVQVVGVVPDFKNRGVRHPVIPEVLLPYSISGLGGFNVVARTSGDPRALARILESTALRLDASAVVRHTRTLEDTLEAEIYSRPRFALRIFAVFAALGIALVSVGLYGATAHMISQRRRELGIRVAVGATHADLLALLIGTEMRAILAGILAGVVLSLASTRLLRAQLWGISPNDPVTLSTVVGTLILIGLAACCFPSLAATRLDPVATLRAE
jgi:putative ABC transport system permease protein